MNKKQQKKHIPNFYFAHPTLVDLLRKNNNPKSISDLAGMEYSNFMKTCKIDRNMGIETISKCADAFGMDVIMILIPKDVIAENIKPSLSANKAYNTIEREDLIYILNRLCRIDRKRMEQHVLQLVFQLCNKKFLAHNHSLIQKIKNVIHLIFIHHGKR